MELENELLTSYLSDSQHGVKIHETVGDWGGIVKGLPLETILGLSLFLLRVLGLG